ncbi:MAG: ABC-2 family transporter protein [Lachnospiraceae bacterium]|nr:ABC-2 family transporter protein [Lachnospiraceae bacterium]
MKSLWRYLRLYRIFAVQYIKTTMQSKVDFFIGLGGFLVSQVAGIAFLYLVFEQIPSMQNWSFEQMLFIYGFAQIPRGLDHLLTDNLWMVSWQMIIRGTFDKYMLRPMNVFFQIVCEKVQLDAFGELLVGIVLVIRAVQKGTVEVTPLKVLFFLVSMLAGAVIYTSVKLFFAAIAFWVKDSSPFLTTAYEMADFAKYPIEIYSKPIQIILMTVLPFAFVAYIPSTFFLVNANVWKTIGAECAIAILFWMVAYGLFKKGLTRYESAGN